jgi:uncharacterized RmlC-like cupin family protein
MLIRLFLLLFASALIGATPDVFEYWSAPTLLSYDQKLAKGEKITTKQLGSYKLHSALVAHRESSGDAEFHEHDADLMVIQTGAASLLIGGRIPNPRTTAPGEIRGAKIDGGSRQKVAPGDIIHIPARTPHQFLLEPGQKITYFTMKVKGQ